MTKGIDVGEDKDEEEDDSVRRDEEDKDFLHRWSPLQY